MKKLTIVITRCKEDLVTLSRLLDSIAHQTFKDIEVILSDDGFEAPSIEHIKDKYAFPIFNVRFDKKTVSHARNIGFQLSRSKYVMFCDCDDMFYDSNPAGLEDAIKKKDDLQEKYMKIAGSTDKFISENSLRRKLEDMRLPYLESVFGYNGGYNAALDDISSYLNGEET